ncbi:uromodulin-like [Xenopus tropicalis]|uniref:Uromodulin-like n=1 Tax=Xenopus tropicalis TaxID=8364 RepID=A0A803J7L5_XENTR|nr:uromodulin-like [Xenopus tropicalis]
MKFCLEFLVILCSLTTVVTSCPTCVSDEICNSITNNCDCNPSTYSETVQIPPPELTCNNNMVLRIPRCQMERNGYDSSSLHLNTPSCRLSSYYANVSYLGILWHIATGECGNTKVENSTHITYYNNLYISPKTSPFITKNNVTFTFSCSIPLNSGTGLNFPVKAITGNDVISVSGVPGSISTTMAIYTDQSFSNIVTTSTTLVVEQNIYVSVLMQTLDNYNIKVVNLYTSASSNRSADPKYYLLQNGCPNLSLGAYLFTTIWNGQFTEARFQFKAFKLASSDVFYLYADYTICNSSCIQNCNSRSADINAQTYSSTVGVRLQFTSNSASSSFGCFSMKWALSSLLLPLILMMIM